MIYGLQFHPEMTRAGARQLIAHCADDLGEGNCVQRPEGMLAEEIPNARLLEANSILEWRLSPARLDDELASFLDEVYGKAKPVGGAKGAASAA